ncbi:uncharacterized protein EI97DRAFT_429116 [Westerdykella ornata]|uniref:Uncharacterized protein n=1 Tax=Westerdykella ornata TaxID=318751 RepID=A0A6A6JY65_WESOR|nr:uncharacterized protein EI97DRAFT_429116 [Westerdykella ornata]KAF2281033.1 hypothetical protein EI97DRAFT_429116 [Westerdykella ornata]
MKLYLAATAALSTVTSAWPLLPWSTQAPPPAGTQFYQLQTKSATTAVNNQWVTLKTGQTSYTLGAQTVATKFFLNQYKPTGTYAIHNADDTRQIALQGPTGVLLYLVDVTNPRTDTIPGGQLMEWATFTTDNNVLGVKDGSTLTNRTFVAVKNSGGYGLALYDGASNTTETISPLTISVVKV